jgi:hypothetical protein
MDICFGWIREQGALRIQVAQTGWWKRRGRHICGIAELWSGVGDIEMHYLSGVNTYLPKF